MNRYYIASLVTLMLCAFNNAQPNELLNSLPENLTITRNDLPILQNGMNSCHSAHTLHDLESDKVSEEGESQLYTVSIELIADVEKFKPVEAVAFNGQGDYSEFMDDFYPTNSFTFHLPAGVYDFAVFFSRVAPDYRFGTNGDVIVIHEQVSVTGNISMSANPLDATQHISFSSYNPDGTKSKVRTISYPEEGSDEYEIVEDGNVKTMAYDTRLYNQEYDYICYWRTMVDPGVIIESGAKLKINAERMTDIYVTPLSDRYVAGQNRLILGADAIYLTDFRCIGSFNGELTNDATGYYTVTSSLKPSQDSNSTPSDQPWILHWSPMWGGQIGQDYFTFRSSKSDVHIVKYCPNHATYCPEEPLASISFAYMDKIERFEEGDWIEILSETRPCCLINSTHNPFVILPVGTYINNTPESDDVKDLFPGNEAYGFEWNQSFDGECVPWMRFMMNADYDEKSGTLHPRADIYYWGLNAESRSDEFSVSAKHDGIQFTGEFDAWLADIPEGGNLDLSFESKQINIDGIQGHNQTSIHINRDNGDGYAPTMTMLQLKNAAGMLTNRFPSEMDANLDFSCGDFNFTLDEEDPNQCWYEYADAEAHVSYSANGRNEWHALPVAEKPELMYLPGFGKHCQADLSTINVLSPNKWYDLKFLFTDLFGNTMEQIISPALRIDKMSSIEPVLGVSAAEVIFQRGGNQLIVSGIENPLVELYSMTGRPVLRALSNVIDISSLEDGIYLVKCSDATGDVFTDKLILAR